MISCLLSIEEPMSPGMEDDRDERPALCPSLFPFMPPTLYFSTANEKGQQTRVVVVGISQTHCLIPQHVPEPQEEVDEPQEEFVSNFYYLFYII